MNGPRLPHIASAITWSALALLVYLLYLVVRPFLVPLGWACVIAVLVHPGHARLEARFGRSHAAAISTLVTAVLLIGPVVLLTFSFAREMVSMGASMQSAIADGRLAWMQRMWDSTLARIPYLANVDLAALTADGLRRTAQALVAGAGSILTNIAVFFVDVILALFATFFLLRDVDGIMRAVRRLLPMPYDEREAFIHRTADLITAGVVSSVTVAGLQGLLGGLAFLVVGLPAPTFWGVVMAVASLLPFGAGVIYVPAAIVLAVNGALTKGILLLALGVAVVSMVDNVVRPIMLSGRAQVHGLVVFIGLLGGLSVFGLIGIVLGPIIIVTALALVDSYVAAAPNDVHIERP